MEVTVVCFGALRDAIGGERSKQVVVGAGSQVLHVLDELKIDQRSVFQILVNEEQTDRSQQVKDGDTVTLMPPFTGG